MYCLYILLSTGKNIHIYVVFIETDIVLNSAMCRPNDISAHSNLIYSIVKRNCMSTELPMKSFFMRPLAVKGDRYGCGAVSFLLPFHEYA